VIGIGTIGQSNAVALSKWEQNPVPASPVALARLNFFVQDMWQLTDEVGVMAPLVFDPAKLDTPTSGTDTLATIPFPFNAALGPIGFVFGPEVYAGLGVSLALGNINLAVVKLAVGGTSLTRLNAVGSNGSFTSWYWPGCHTSWDPSLPRSSTPFVSVAGPSGTSTSVDATSMTDSSLSMATNQFAGYWITRGGSQAIVSSNNATKFTIFGNWWPTTPTNGAYSLDRRAVFEASLLKSYVPGYHKGAADALALAADTLDMRCYAVVFGEQEAADLARAQRAKQNLLNLIWYVRRAVVAGGWTTVTAEKLGFTISKVKDGSATLNYWGAATGRTGSDLYNQAVSEIAIADPYVACISVGDLAVGGLTGSDTVHYTTLSTINHGTRHGQAMVEIINTVTPRARRSHVMFGHHTLVQPVWGVGSTQLDRYAADVTELLAIPASQRRLPVFFIEAEGSGDSVPVYLTPTREAVDNERGTLVGYARPRLAAGMVDITAATKYERPSKVARRGIDSGSRVRGAVWKAGSISGFDEVPIQSPSTNQNHVISPAFGAGGVITRWSTEIPASGINREWLLRSARGSFGVSARLLIDEVIAGTERWMRHELSNGGDYTPAQSAGVAVTKLAPTLDVVGRLGFVRGRSLAMEFNADSGAPLTAAPAIFDSSTQAPINPTALEVDHGGTNSRGVLWPGVRMAQQVDMHWRDIEGCFRFVFEVSPDHDLGDDASTLVMAPTIWLQGPAFDAQFVYDPDLNLNTDLAWTPTNNRWRRLLSQATVVHNKDNTVNSTTGPMLSKDRGVVGWTSTGGFGAPPDGLTVGVYAAIRETSTETMDQVRHLTCGNKAEPTPATVPGFAAYDQLDYAYLRQTMQITGKPILAGTTRRWAMFVLVGTMAQVQAAALQLAQLGVDAQWVD